ncbi:MAG: prepilin-type cleavage/methylation domain-containing protein [Alicyclobacillus herbarius]|uniref:pilus assembly FimT family protein n=1 Tax=Alicyclobacillus herbarius TaxID=122960 RepID=UPI00235311CD|nr:prepilin-type cleavage/methylation domain-containing protein [Alicyclobacillus herbarius]MCL6631632.1 prepilin-type cleavage/methylation domain-containing protein [Alicyclobacillus herbarius]
MTQDPAAVARQAKQKQRAWRGLRFRQRLDECSDVDAGFSLLEVCVAVALTGISLAIPAVGFSGMWQSMQLYESTENLLWDFRTTQMLSQSVGPYAVVNLHKYQPQYDLLIGPTTVAQKSFLSGVDYKDGYLQMRTGWISFDSAGDAHVAGVIRLTNGLQESDLHIYTGAGWVSFGPDADPGGGS